jgi:hypothetical protein
MKDLFSNKKRKISENTFFMFLLIIICFVGSSLKAVEPPMKEILVKIQYGRRINLSTFDPIREKWMADSWSSLDQIHGLEVKDGVATWMAGNNQLLMATYDFARMKWSKYRFSHFRSCSTLSNRNGIVVWLVSGSALHCATFDPSRGKWRITVTSIDDRIVNLINRDGVVAWQTAANRVGFALYDPELGKWQKGSYVASNLVGDLRLANGSIEFTSGAGYGWRTHIRGYDSGLGRWVEGHTRPKAFFAVIPISDRSGFSWWIIDMSIGGEDVQYTLGGKPFYFRRSFFYTGWEEVLTVSQRVFGPSGTNSRQVTMDFYGGKIN